MLLTKRELFLL